MKMKLLTFAVGLVFSHNAFSLPTLYPMNETLLSTIVNTTNSNLVADSVDQHVIYVMPPNSAYSFVNGLHSITANIGFCQEMGNLQTYSRDISAKIASLTMLSEERFKIYEQKNAQLKEARLQLAQYAVANDMNELVELDDKLSATERKISKVLEDSQSCTQFCSDLRTEYKELRKIRSELKQKRGELADRFDSRIQKYTKHQRKVEALVEDLKASREAWQSLQDTLMENQSNFVKMYKIYGELEGALAHVKFTSNWDQNIASLRQQNAGFDFKKIETKNTVITSNIADVKSLPRSGAILGYMIGGAYEEGKLSLPSYPEELSGNIRLSLIGACPVLHPDYFDINLPNGSDQMRYGLTVAYDYPSAFTTRVQMKYNMHKMYQKIVSSGSRGGFFRRRSWTSVEERTEFKDSFRVEWLEQDASNRLTDEEKADLEKDMRNSIFARLAAIGLPAAANAGQLVVPTPGASGAIVLSNALKKQCPGNAYCIAGSVALDVLDSIFGSSSASASYRNIQDADMSEEWSRTLVSYKPWVTTYN